MAPIGSFPPSPVVRLVSVSDDRLAVLCADGDVYFLDSDARWGIAAGEVYLLETPPPGAETSCWVAFACDEAEGEVLQRTWACHPNRWKAWRRALEDQEQEQIVARLRAESAPAAPNHPAATTTEGPISSWLAVARAVGIDDSTIRAHRRRTGDATPPYFESAAAARAWYAALRTAPDTRPALPSHRRRRARLAKEHAGAVNWKTVQV
jgi:hypothetical protein